MKKILIFISIFYFGNTQAQESIYTSGGNAVGSGGTLSYSIGQLTFNEDSDGIYTVSQGIQQPIESYTVLSLDNYQNINLQVLAFPNPTTNYLNLSFNKYNNKLTYQLYDIHGRLLQTKNKLKKEEIIHMKNLVSATYFLNISKKNQIIKTFKIVKN